MNMGGGENYHVVTTQDTSAQQNVSSSNVSEKQETENMIGGIGAPTSNDLAEENKVIEDAEIAKNNIEQQQNVSTPVEVASVENSKPEDSTDKETTQQTAVQDPQIVSQQIEANSKPEDSTNKETTQQNAVQDPQITSQQIWEFEQSIKKEEAGKTPLVCLTEGIQELYQEYEQGSEVYRQKIMVCYLLCISTSHHVLMMV